MRNKTTIKLEHIKYFFGFILLSSVLVFTNCNNKDNNNETPVVPEETPDENKVVNVGANITENTTWTTGNIYVLTTRVAVESGATLTIQPGVIVKGQPGTEASAKALIIARGAKIMAEGTAKEPIIFTASSDEMTYANIQAGNFGSPNLSNTTNGLWGGLIVLGNARISASGDGEDAGDVSELQIEGIPATDKNGLYGGNDDADNSGILRYVSIRHGGTNIGASNEINGLTLGGVGSGTTIENIEVVANQDDGIEWFGGTVNVTNALVWNVADDGIDTDQSWAGTLDNFIVITPAGHCFELDGPEGSYEASHTITNGTVLASKGTRTSKDLINVDANSRVSLENIFITGITSTDQTVNESEEDGTLADAPEVSFSNVALDVPAASLGDYVDADPVPSGISAASSSTNKADKSVFSWTWAFQSGELDNL